MRILLTGVAGFIAGRVAELLLEQGHEVRGGDNLCPADDVRLKDYRLGRLEGRPGYDFRRVDITHRDDLATVWEE